MDVTANFSEQRRFLGIRATPQTFHRKDALKGKIPEVLLLDFRKTAF